MASMNLTMSPSNNLAALHCDVNWHSHCCCEVSWRPSRTWVSVKTLQILFTIQLHTHIVCLSTSLLVACKSWERKNEKKRKTYHFWTKTYHFWTKTYHFWTKTYQFWTKTYPIWKAGGEGGCNVSLNKKKRPRVVYKFLVPPCCSPINL